MPAVTAVQSGRNLPLLETTPYVFGGVSDTWVKPNTVGTLTNASFGILDLRAAWSQPLPRSTSLELFLDIFNVLDNQAYTRNQDLVAGQGPGPEFGNGPSAFAPAAPPLPGRPLPVLVVRSTAFVGRGRLRAPSLERKGRAQRAEDEASWLSPRILPSALALKSEE